MSKYSTVIFDLFDTLIDFNPSKLPTIEYKNNHINTTAFEVYRIFSFLL